MRKSKIRFLKRMAKKKYGLIYITPRDGGYDQHIYDAVVRQGGKIFYQW